MGNVTKIDTMSMKKLEFVGVQFGVKYTIDLIPNTCQFIDFIRTRDRNLPRKLILLLLRNVHHFNLFHVSLTYFILFCIIYRFFIIGLSFSTFGDTKMEEPYWLMRDRRLAEQGLFHTKPLFGAVCLFDYCC